LAALNTCEGSDSRRDHAVHNGENPRAIREKLNSFLSNARLKLLEEQAKVKEKTTENT
jgi:flagellar motor component MotA